MLDIHGQKSTIYFLAQPILIQPGVVDIVVDFLFDHIFAGQSLSPSGAIQGNAMSGAVADQHTGPTGRVGVVTTSENITCLFVDDREPVKGFAAIVKDYERFHAIGCLRPESIVPNPYHCDFEK